MKYYLVQVKTNKKDKFHGVPVREVSLCKDCVHLYKREIDNQYVCSLTGNVKDKYDFCSDCEKREKWQE